jgi:glyoxylate reductase
VSAPLVVVARGLLPAGLEPLAARYEVREGGLDSGPEQWRELARGAAGLVADASVPVDEELIDACGPGLRVVGNFAVGYDNVDLAACAKRGVTVTNTPDVLTSATAELALALTLAAARRLSDAERELRAGKWHGWDPAAHRGLELTGSTVGVVGMGRIGRRYAELVTGFGVELLYANPSAKPEAERSLGAVRVDLPGLLGRADVVSLHAPASAETHHLIDADALQRMKPGAVLVNTARGSLVDAIAVAEALRKGWLGAAGIDVYEGEPSVPAKLLEAPRAVLAPHIGSATVKARDAMARTVADNVIAVLEGRDPPNPVTIAPG